MRDFATDLTQDTGGEHYTEWLKCKNDVIYFIVTYCYIFDSVKEDWIKFNLWESQIESLKEFSFHKLIVILKARQEGYTWLVVCYFIWRMIFHPKAVILIFSKEQDISIQILDYRMKGIHGRLPEWMKDKTSRSGGRIKKDDSKTSWQLSNGSMVRAFTSKGGDSYTATHALIDEADLVENLQELMGRVGPTIDAGGQLILLSRVDKSKPNSHFKNIYNAAKINANGWHPMFLSWRARPDRTQEWYDLKCAASMASTGSLDDVYEQYPETDGQALSARSSDARLPAAWVDQCFEACDIIHYSQLPNEIASLPSLRVYRLPEEGRRYVISADPAEGKKDSNDSAAMVMDRDSGEEVAIIRGKIETYVLADYIDLLANWYNLADVLIEKNNHGHSVLMWLEENSNVTLLCGPDDHVGWLESSKTKPLLYSEGASALKDKQVLFHSHDVKSQLLSIQHGSLKSPEGMPDDLAITAVLAHMATTIQSGMGTVISVGQSSYLGRGRVIPISSGVDLILSELEKVKQRRIA